MMNMDGMGSMMAWVMGLGMLGWVLVIGLLVTIVVLLVGLLARTSSKAPPQDSGPVGPPNRAH
jgi:hypothetical protein